MSGPKLGGVGRGGVGVLLGGVLLMVGLTGCPWLEPSEQVWCGTFTGKENLTVLAYPLEQDMAGGARCYTLVSCGGTEYALALEPDGKCNVRVDLPTPEEGTVRAGGRCERGTDRLTSRSRDVGTATGGKVTIRDGRLEADIQWEVLVHTPGSRVGGTQAWTFRDGARAAGPGLEIPAEDACRLPAPAEPEDFSKVVGCRPEDFVYLNKADAERVVRFGGEPGPQYTPRCIIIEAGQRVSFEGSFREYPMTSGTSADPTLGSPYNPIFYRSTGDFAAYTFSRPGDYVYSCQFYESQGMRGLIRVL